MSGQHRNDTVFNANDLVSSVIERWRKGEQPNTAQVLDSHPELRRERSLVVDLAYTEYSLRKQAGESLTPRDFGDRFPSFRQAILRSIEVQEFMEGHPEFAAELAGPIWPEPGDELAGFKIAELLGRGALARVYLARETAVGNRLVVVKVAQDGESEAQLLGKLAHDNIMEIHSVRHDELTGLTLICTPLVGTATLVELLDQAFADNQSPVSSEVIARVALQRQPAGAPIADLGMPRLEHASYVEAIAQLGLQLARALEAAHREGITHRDIKPSNVLLSWQAKPLLLDFNLSTDPNQPLKRLGGTHAYMPPERLRAILAQRAELDPRTDPRGDIYSWGVLVYQLLTGRLPFVPATIPAGEDEQLQAWLDCQLPLPPPATELNPRVDRELEAIVERCLSSTAAGRYATARELAEVLEKYLSRRSRLVRYTRRHRRRFVVAAAGLLFSAGAGAVYLGTRPDAFTRQYRAGLEFYEAGKFPEAIESFSFCLKAQPKHPAVLFARGQAYRRKGDFASARQDFLPLLELAPREAVYRCLADCDIELKDFLLASGRFEKAISQGLQSAEIYNNQAYCYLRSSPKRSRQIIEAADKALNMNRELISGHYLRAAGILRLTGAPLSKEKGLPQLQSALSDVSFILRSGVSTIDVHEVAAQLFEAAGQQDSANEQIRRLNELGKTHQELSRLFTPQRVVKALGDNHGSSPDRVTQVRQWNSYISPSPSPCLPPPILLSVKTKPPGLQRH